MSSVAERTGRSAMAGGLYGLVAIIGAFEVWVLWLMLNPAVTPDYRAYYIDRTTTCLNQPVSGAYTLGTVIDFAMAGRQEAKTVKVCGWEGPAGDGTHAVGESSRLRFALPEGAENLELELGMIAVKHPDAPRQRVEVWLNGTRLGEAIAGPGRTQVFAFPVPPGLRLNATAEVELRYPDAVRMRDTDSNTRKRSIRLLTARLHAAGPG